MNVLNRPWPKSIVLILGAVATILALSLAPMVQTYIAYSFMDTDGFKAWLSSQPVAFYQFVLTSFAVMGVIAGYLTYKSRQEAKQETEEACTRMEEDFKRQTDAKASELHGYAEELKKSMQDELERYQSTMAEARRNVQRVGSETTDQVKKTGEDGIAKVKKVADEMETKIQGIQLPRMEETDRERKAREAFNCGVHEYQAGDVDRAIASWRNAISLKPDYPEAHNNLGAAAIWKGDLDGAIAEFHEAIRLKPDYPEAHNNLGAAASEKGDHDGAIAEIHEAIRLNPDHASAHDNLGVALGRKGDNDGAIAEHREAIRLRPDFVEAHDNLGVALCRNGDYDGAVVEHREAIRLKPGNANAHYNLAWPLALQRKFAEAATSLRRAIELNSKYLDMARKDHDFDGIRNAPEIIEILGKPPYGELGAERPRDAAGPIPAPNGDPPRTAPDAQAAGTTDPPKA